MGPYVNSNKTAMPGSIIRYNRELRFIFTAISFIFFFLFNETSSPAPGNGSGKNFSASVQPV